MRCFCLSFVVTFVLRSLRQWREGTATFYSSANTHHHQHHHNPSQLQTDVVSCVRGTAGESVLPVFPVWSCEKDLCFLLSRNKHTPIHTLYIMWEALLLSCFRNGSIFHTLQWLENSAPRWTLTQTIQGGRGGGPTSSHFYYRKLTLVRS